MTISDSRAPASPSPSPATLHPSPKSSEANTLGGVRNERNSALVDGRQVTRVRGSTGEEGMPHDNSPSASNVPPLIATGHGLEGRGSGGWSSGQGQGGSTHKMVPALNLGSASPVHTSSAELPRRDFSGIGRGRGGEGGTLPRSASPRGVTSRRDMRRGVGRGGRGSDESSEYGGLNPKGKRLGMGSADEGETVDAVSEVRIVGGYELVMDGKGKGGLML